jgi:Tfp pilus assembly protein PilN
MAVALALEVKRANEVLRQLSIPWGGLFQTLESAGGKDVALLALEPDTEKRLVKISGEAKSIAAMLDYIKQLENRDVLGTVYLQSHHVQLQDPEKPVRFELLAIWRVKS